MSTIVVLGEEAEELPRAPIPPEPSLSGREGSAGRAPRPRQCSRSFAPDVHGARLTRRGRLVVSLVWLAFVGAMAILLTRPEWVHGEGESVETSTVSIEAGDTLWGLANRVAPGVDPRETVAQIMELNGLESGGDIRPGDVVEVPLSAGFGGD